MIGLKTAIETLERRIGYLSKRIEAWPNPLRHLNGSYDEQERAALKVALKALNEKRDARNQAAHALKIEN